MNDLGLPEDVLRFLDAKIETVPHLEALVILWQSASVWTASVLARRIYLEVPATEDILHDLRRAGLAVSTDDLQFSYDAVWDHTGLMMTKVAATYRSNISRIAVHIHNRASSSVREFARAFDMKKER